MGRKREGEIAIPSLRGKIPEVGVGSELDEESENESYDELLLNEMFEEWEGDREAED